MRSDRAAVASALVRIKLPDGSGSGVAVNTRDGVRILTSEHVVRGHEECTVVMRTDTEGEFVFSENTATVERVNKKWDLALLKMHEEGPHEVQPLEVAKDEPDLYEPVILGACPNDCFGVVLDGLLQGRGGSLGPDMDSSDYLFSGLAAHGSSGGAMANIEQELVGIITATSRDEEQLIHPLGHATPLAAIRRFLQRKPRLGVVKATVEFTPDWEPAPRCHLYDEGKFGRCIACDKEKEDPVHD